MVAARLVVVRRAVWQRCRWCALFARVCCGAHGFMRARGDARLWIFAQPCVACVLFDAASAYGGAVCGWRQRARVFAARTAALWRSFLWPSFARCRAP